MFKKTLLALAVAGVSITATAATVKTGVSADATTAADAATALVKRIGDKKSGLGVDNVFGGATDDNCEQLATEYSATVIETATITTGSDHTATFGTATKGNTNNVVEYTAAKACTVYLAAETSSATTKDGVEYSTVKAIEIKPVVVAGIGGYKDEDTLTFKISGAKLDTSKTVSPQIVVDTLGTSTGNVTFDVLDIEEDQVRFTVQGANAQNDFVRGGAALQLSGLFLDSTGLSNSTSVTINSFATNTSGTQFDVAKAAVITTLVPQYSAEVTTAFDADIDVGKDRQEFANGTGDTLTLKVEKNTDNLELVPATATYVIAGDFSWMLDDDIDANEDGKLSSTEIGSAVAYAGTNDTVASYALNSTNTELTVKTTVVAPVDAAPAFTFTVPGYDQGKLENVMIPVQSFTAKVDVLSDKSIGSGAANMPALAASSAGAWELNGSVVVLPYIPFGPNTQPILRHTNAGTRVGDVSMRYMIEGEDVTWKALPAASLKDVKPGVRNILSLVTDALKAEGYDASATGFKAAIEVVTNVPSRDVHVFAGAKVDSSDSSRINLGSYKTNN
ncbi:hypothetical protein FHG08_05950 [Pseudoalteromonas sp. Scap03]|uniref:hypothetical protein n=1 Tax=unclassified Pseudoalteromonas TaxID=194690 RepID=UPI0015C0DF1F|nr:MULTISPECIES: hypothetical protein [unclassified Pseudoalteromonas]NWL15271.1 hypothetical protein [Pseudoalteromonas sp. Scap03]QLE80423.1 hypothetical protein FLM54_02215 [Pseudoalteromonas sp. Scap25]QLE88366.1 hypothetical protein FLM47_02215 [Pseudoalteromonas sp. Scap06]